MNQNAVIALISSIRTFADEWLREELGKAGVKDICPSHGHILHSLFKKNGLTMGEINEKINKKKNTVTVLIDKLVALGYIGKKKDIQDKRITRIYLTKKGRSLESLFNEVSQNLIEKAYWGFNRKEKKLTVILLEKMEKNFK
jgi:MarR family transcriptional regulator, organic hydroperoxide resistance regulator